jgi:hypothetical protein
LCWAHGAQGEGYPIDLVFKDCGLYENTIVSIFMNNLENLELIKLAEDSQDCRAVQARSRRGRRSSGSDLGALALSHGCAEHRL